jgi:hypothetical protein
MTIIFISIVINFFIETLSWYLKSISLPGNMAKSISISNMVLYSSRVFNYLFITSISLYVDRNLNLRLLVVTILFSMYCSFIIHLVFFTSQYSLQILHKNFIFFLKPFSKIRSTVSQHIFYKVERRVLDIKILILTTLSSLLFSVTLVGPYLFIYFLPNYKLTIVSIGSIGNFLATIPLIFYVDYIMYSYMDKAILIDYLYSYILGRALGFLLFAILLTFLFFKYFS